MLRPSIIQELGLLSRSAFSRPAIRSSYSPFRLGRCKSRLSSQDTVQTRFFSSSIVSKARRPYYQYEPPKRSFWDSLDNKTVIYSIGGANVLVFGLWFWAKSEAEVNRNFKPYVWMRQNFVCSLENLKQGRIWTFFTYAFSHRDFPHILFNGIGLFFVSRSVLDMLGPKRFLTLYLGSAVSSVLMAMAWYDVSKSRSTDYVGASGAIYATFSFLACAAPTSTFLLYGIIPVPAWLMVAGLFAFDLYGSRDLTSSTGHAAHVGGLISGAAYFLARRYRIM